MSFIDNYTKKNWESPPDLFSSNFGMDYSFKTRNFCLPFKTKEGKQTTVKTPAQRLGITDKEFSLEDIIYLR